MKICAVMWAATVLVCAGSPARAGNTFDGQADNTVYSYYYVLTGGINVGTTTRNGDSATGGVFRSINDEVSWNRPDAYQTWAQESWFPENKGLAMTLKNGNTIVYDNNGIETRTMPGGTGAGGYYNNSGGGDDGSKPGLIRGFSMHNNWDWVYASYFKTTSAITVSSITGYFDGNGSSVGPFNPFATNVEYRMNIWSEAAGQLPTNTGSFVGDVLSSVTTAGTFAVSDTGVSRVFQDGSTDPIDRLTYAFRTPVVLPAGNYYFSHSAGFTTVPEPATFSLLGAAAVGLLLRRRR